MYFPLMVGPRVAAKAVGLLVTAAVAGAFSCADQGRGSPSSTTLSSAAFAGDASATTARDTARAVEGRRLSGPVVIVTLDGVRWQEVYGGTDPVRSRAPALSAKAIAPTLHRLGTQRGAFVGAPGHGTVSASGPNYISLPGYTEILGGRPPFECQSNDCPRTTLPSILDEARATGARVGAFASWSPLGLAATSAPGGFVLSCGQPPGQPRVSPSPGYGDYRPDRVTADAALAWFEAEDPDLFFLGLGDPDEHAHHGNYRAYIESIQKADAILARLVAILDRSERGRRAHLIITSDHGRAHDFWSHGAMPEAARVWLVAVGPTFTARGRVDSPRPRRLADIAPTLRQLLDIPPDTSMHAGQPLSELFGPP